MACMILGLFSCGQKSEKLLLAGSGWNKIVIIDKETKQVEWEHPIHSDWECNSASWTPDGNILFSYKKGAKLINMKGEELWNFEADKGSEFQTARVLDNGNYLIAECGHPAKIFEVTPKGKIVKETHYETGIDHPHAQFRHVNVDKKGNYLIPLFATSDVRVVDVQGNLVRTIKMPGNMFGVSLLPNGNYLGACGDSHRYVEFNLESGKILKTVNSGDIEGIQFCFLAQILPVDNGEIYICNWQGHDKTVADKKIPQLIQIDKNGKVIWSVNDNKNFEIGRAHV